MLPLRVNRIARDREVFKQTIARKDALQLIAGLNLVVTNRYVSEGCCGILGIAFTDRY